MGGDFSPSSSSSSLSSSSFVAKAGAVFGALPPKRLLPAFALEKRPPEVAGVPLPNRLPPAGGLLPKRPVDGAAPKRPPLAGALPKSEAGFLSSLAGAAAVSAGFAPKSPNFCAPSPLVVLVALPNRPVDD